MALIFSIKRGDIVICAAPGDYGKPRPAVVVQSNLFNGEHPSVVVCLITSELLDLPLFRIEIEPSAANGLRRKSQVMIDKTTVVPRPRIRKNAGALTEKEMAQIGAAMRLWLGLEDNDAAGD